MAPCSCPPPIGWRSSSQAEKAPSAFTTKTTTAWTTPIAKRPPAAAIIQLNGIRSQDPANPSVLPFSVDGTSEIYFGKNLATVATTALGQGRFEGQKTVVTYTDVGLDGGFNIGRESISFEEDIEDFNYPACP